MSQTLSNQQYPDIGLETLSDARTQGVSAPSGYISLSGIRSPYKDMDSEMITELLSWKNENLSAKLPNDCRESDIGESWLSHEVIIQSDFISEVQPINNNIGSFIIDENYAVWISGLMDSPTVDLIRLPKKHYSITARFHFPKKQIVKKKFPKMEVEKDEFVKFKPKRTYKIRAQFKFIK